MSSYQYASAEDGILLCNEARRLRAMRQALHDETLRLLNDLWDIQAEGQKRIALARHCQELRKKREAQTRERRNMQQ